jgi:starch phosphorylase
MSENQKNQNEEALFNNKSLGMDSESIKRSFINHIKFSRAKGEYAATTHDCYSGLALATKDRLIERWINTQQTYYKQKAKRV